MKKLLIFSLMVFFVSPVFAQSTPKKVKKAFALMVPEAQDAKWSTPKERTSTKDRKYTVNYVVDNDSIFSRFDYKANWLLTVTYMAVEDLPEAVTSSITSKYMNAKITTAARLEEPGFDGYGVIYMYMRDQWTVQISKEGKILRRILQSDGFKFN